MGHPKVGAGGGGEAGSTHLWVCPRDQLDGGNAGAVGGSSVLAAGSRMLLPSRLRGPSVPYKGHDCEVPHVELGVVLRFCFPAFLCSPHAGGSWLPAAVP